MGAQSWVGWGACVCACKGWGGWAAGRRPGRSSSLLEQPGRALDAAPLAAAALSGAARRGAGTPAPAGFTKRSESAYDPFGAGHSSTSISAALGMAVGRDFKGRKNNCIAVGGWVGGWEGRKGRGGAGRGGAGPGGDGRQPWCITWGRDCGSEEVRLPPAL